MRDTQYFPVAEAKALYEAGASLTEIGAKLDPPRDRKTVGHWLKRAGVVLRSRGGLRDTSWKPGHFARLNGGG